MARVAVEVDHDSFAEAKEAVAGLTQALHDLDRACDFDFDDKTEVVPLKDLTQRSRHPMDIIRFFWKAA